jgi:hypothetical protein
VTHLGLADSVDAAEALLDPLGIPRQVIGDHQMRALRVDAPARRVGGDQDQADRDAGEAHLCGAAIVARHSLTIISSVPARRGGRVAHALLRTLERLTAIGRRQYRLVCYCSLWLPYPATRAFEDPPLRAIRTIVSSSGLHER